MSRAAENAFAAADAIPLLARVADALAWPLMVLDDTGRLQHANRVARALLALGEPLQHAAGEPVQPRADAQRGAFRAALRDAVAGATTTLCLAASGALSLVTLRPLGLLGPVYPLHPPPWMQDAPARCLLTVVPARAWRPDVAACARALSLSATQTRVLHGLAQGHDTARLAAALGVKTRTVRGHVATVCRKTGCASATALVQALRCLPPAVGPMAEGECEGE